ncbi:MAG TPA: TIGR04295 family B12-binding domain-containing radical SAM protein [Polyangia bacterium]
MKIALINPAWRYEGSIYFGCREPHLPLELGYARAWLEADGHEVMLIDAHADPRLDVPARAGAFGAELAVVTTAPTYLFWRCPPPELRAPRGVVAALRKLGCATVAVGPHGSTSPVTTLRKLGVDAVVVGECEEAVARLARAPRAEWSGLDGVLVASDAEAVAAGRRPPPRPVASDLARQPPLRWRPGELGRHVHHHHRFDSCDPGGLGAEVEASRGCPFSCTFCAKTTHRDRYRRRPLDAVAEELDHLVAEGVTYLYFIDEIFLPDAALLQLLESRPVRFGIQTRIDLWTPEQLDDLGRAGCVSIEAGIESVSSAGRRALDKRCRLDTEALSERLMRARSSVPFVQATLMDSQHDTAGDIAAWTAKWRASGIWVNEPVPLFPYPGSPDYERLWGRPDERAWERAHEHYLSRFGTFSDLQDARPVRLPVLESLEGEVEA